MKPIGDIGEPDDGGTVFVAGWFGPDEEWMLANVLADLNRPDLNGEDIVSEVVSMPNGLEVRRVPAKSIECVECGSEFCTEHPMETLDGIFLRSIREKIRKKREGQMTNDQG